MPRGSRQTLLLLVFQSYSTLTWASSAAITVSVPSGMPGIQLANHWNYSSDELPDAHYLLQNFIWSTFGNSEILGKWMTEETIVVTLYSNDFTPYVEWLDLLIGYLSETSGLNFSIRMNYYVLNLEPNHNQIDLVILDKSDRPVVKEHLKKISQDNNRTLHGKICNGQDLFYESNHQLLGYVAFIDPERFPEATMSCIATQMFFALGLGRSSVVWNNSPLFLSPGFNLNPGGSFRLEDMILLHTLYDPRLLPGMTPDEASPIAEVIIRETLDELRRPATP
jgi:hypothetical protein